MESWSTRAPPESSDNSMCPTWTSRPREEDMPDSSWGRKRSMSTKWGRATTATNMAATRVAATFMPLLFITPLLENRWAGVNHQPSLSSATNPEKRGQRKKPPVRRRLRTTSDYVLCFGYFSFGHRHARADQLRTGDQGSLDGLRLGNLELFVPNLAQSLLYEAEHHEPADCSQREQVDIEGRAE